MPLFDYRCSECGKTVERLEKFSAPSERPCDCAQLGVLKRQLSAGSFHLKGTGWYAPGFSGKSHEQV